MTEYSQTDRKQPKFEARGWSHSLIFRSILESHFAFSYLSQCPHSEYIELPQLKGDPQ